jgi:hypothetical protein
MNTLMEVKLSLDPEHAAKLADLAGGEANINEYAASVLQDALANGQVPDADIEPSNDDPLLLVDLYG